MIAKAACYLAERRGFGPGHKREDRVLAERQLEGPVTSNARCDKEDKIPR